MIDLIKKGNFVASILNSNFVIFFLSYFFVKKIPLSRRVEYVMDRG